MKRQDRRSRFLVIEDYIVNIVNALRWLYWDSITCFRKVDLAEQHFSNPYQAPEYVEQPTSWWRCLLRLLLGEGDFLDRFLRGEQVMQYGVLYFVDPNDNTVINAAVPVSEVNPQTKRLLILEARRELQNLIQQNEELKNVVQNRKIKVIFIANYQNIDDQICDPIVVDWSPDEKDSKSSLDSTISYES